MNEKNLPDDIASKSLNELTDLADEIIKAKGNKFPFDPKREKKLIKKTSPET